MRKTIVCCHCVTYPINHSTVSRRYSGSRSSLAVLFDLSNCEIIIVAKSIRRCYCYTASLARYYSVVISCAVFLCSMFALEKWWVLLWFFSSSCVCVFLCTMGCVALPQTLYHLTQNTICTRNVTQFTNIRTPNIRIFPLYNEFKLFFNSWLKFQFIRFLCGFCFFSVFPNIKHKNVQSPFDCIIFICKLFFFFFFFLL